MAGRVLRMSTLSASRIFSRKKESSSFTMTGSARRILISRRIPASGRWSGFAKRWSRPGRHSACGMLAIEYALKYRRHLKALVISNMTASIASYVTYIDVLRRQLSPEMIRTLEKYEALGEYAAAEYQDVIFRQIYTKHLCRIDPWPEPLVRMFRHLNTTVYNTMQGPNEFVVTGTFKDWDRWSDLKEIRVPTLLSVGRFDTMSVADIERMGSLIPHARVAVCERGSHCSMYDDQENYFRDLIRFIKDVET